LTFLPRNIRPKAPPIKTQGIKTKVIPLISSSIAWDGKGRWIEPFLGSAAVALNIAPQRAVLADTNEHLITFYKGIQSGLVSGRSMREYLEKEGSHLLDNGESHYYKVRDRFNETGNPFDFIYCDPPYVGRHTDYYNGFNDEESNDLANALIKSPASFALSNWLENKYRRNDFVDLWFSNYEQRTMSHFYHVGPQESLRNEMIEVVILSPSAAAPTVTTSKKEFLPLFETFETAELV